MTSGNFFEDFSVGQLFQHPLPRTVSDADISLYIALTGSRNPLMSSAPLAAAMGHSSRPLDDLLIFNIAFGKSVTDVSLNAIANLGYADVRFLAPVYSGDTLASRSQVIGLRETSSGDGGIVYVQSEATNQRGELVLSWIRWVLVRKQRPVRSEGSNFPPLPELPLAVATKDLAPPAGEIDFAALALATGSEVCWEDYDAGQRLDHAAGMTIEESDHMSATRLYQNDARVHFDGLMMRDTPHGRRLVYGGHVMSICRAISSDGLENILGILAINGGSHVAPTFAGDTLYSVTQVLESFPIPGRSDIGALRLRLIGLRDLLPANFELSEQPADVRRHRNVVLDLDYSVVLPRRAA